MPVTTAYGEQFICDAILAKLVADGKTPHAQLTTTAPSKASAGTAFTGASRVACTLSRTNDTLTNNLVDFGNSTADGSLVGIEIWDAASSGNRLFYGLLTGQPISVSTGQPVRIPAGQFVYSPDA